MGWPAFCKNNLSCEMAAADQRPPSSAASDLRSFSAWAQVLPDGAHRPNVGAKSGQLGGKPEHFLGGVGALDKISVEHTDARFFARTRRVNHDAILTEFPAGRAQEIFDGGFLARIGGHQLD